jgi:hypothetical protein
VADGARRLAGVPLEVVTPGASAFPPGAVDAAQPQPQPLGALAQPEGEALSPLLQLAPHFHYVGRLAMPCGREPLLRDAIPCPWERCRTAARKSLLGSPRPVRR